MKFEVTYSRTESGSVIVEADSEAEAESKADPMYIEKTDRTEWEFEFAVPVFEPTTEISLTESEKKALLRVCRDYLDYILDSEPEDYEDEVKAYTMLFERLGEKKDAEDYRRWYREAVEETAQ